MCMCEVGLAVCTLSLISFPLAIVRYKVSACGIVTEIRNDRCRPYSTMPGI